MEESSEQEETPKYLLNSDHSDHQNHTASENPQSGKPQGEIQTTTLSSVDPPGKIVDELASGMNQMEEQQQQQQFGEVEDGDDLAYQNALDEEIRQLIYKESLSEAVMNLALEGGYQHRNGSGGNEESSYFYGLGAETEIGIGEAGHGMGANGKVKEGSEVEEGRNGNEGVMPGQYLNEYGNDSAEVEEEEGGYRAAENGGFGGNKNYSKRQLQYPLRIDAEDCAFYMKTGNCKFGMNCKFNHPPKRRNLVSRDRSKPRTEDLERVGQTECKYYLTSGGCKFGNACKYSHNKGRSTVSPILELNFLGLPIRLGERECPYYMRTGSCKYGSNCKFNHPDPTPASGNDIPSGVGNIGSNKLHAQSADMSWSSSSVMLPQSPTVPSNSDWNGYQAVSYPASEGSLPTPPAFAMNNLFTTHPQQHISVGEFPQRPGHPECSYYLRTGDCKYKANCRFHHPKLQSTQQMPCGLSEKGLPLRPDQSICSFYNRYGICKFGPACKFDHPENWGTSLPADGVGMSRSEMEAGFS